MASKPGQVDMRCSDAVQSAFLLHPHYATMKETIEVGVVRVESGHWSFAQYLPATDARRALEPCLPEIARKQQRTGMWFRKNAEAYTYDILLGLGTAELLPEIVEDGTLRYDPYLSFAAADTEWGFLVRHTVMKQLKEGDEDLQTELIARHTQEQGENGSWDGAVSGTALRVERLLELGVPSESEILKKAAEWLLSQFKETIIRRRPNSSMEIAVRNLITSDNCPAEHAAASGFLEHHNLASSCFNSVPIVQTGLALRALIRLGFEEDERVRLAIESLLDIQTKTHEHTLDLPNMPLGHWCAHQCRFKLEEREKERRRSKGKQK